MPKEKAGVAACSEPPASLLLITSNQNMAPKNKAEVVESKTPAEFFSEHQSICGFDNVSSWVGA